MWTTNTKLGRVYFNTSDSSPNLNELSTYKVFEYKWLHLPSGLSGTRFCECDSYASFLALLDKWNQAKDWKYSSK